MLYWLTLFLFGLTYILLAIGSIPGLKTDRAGIAVVGAALMLAVGLVPFDEAFGPHLMDTKVLVLLFGLMILVGALRLGGLFERVQTLLTGTSPLTLLALVLVLSGVLSAFLVNDIVCVAFTPLLLAHCRRVGFHPVPHLMALATGSNLGSAAAITGNPQNMYIGTNSGIPYLRFLAKLGPPAFLALIIAFGLIAWLYRQQLAQSHPSETEESPEPTPLPVWFMAVAGVAVLLFFVLPSSALPLIALGAAAVVLLSRIPPERLFAQVDWPLLVLFAGLFIIVGAFRKHVMPTWEVETWTWLRDDPVYALSGVSVVLSNLVSNVPAVMLFKDLIEAMPEANRETAWLALAISSTFAGNLTVIGSVANLIVVEGARREGVEITFYEYARVGVPLTILTLILGVGWLALARY